MPYSRCISTLTIFILCFTINSDQCSYLYLYMILTSCIYLCCLFCNYYVVSVSLLLSLNEPGSLCSFLWLNCLITIIMFISVSKLHILISIVICLFVYFESGSHITQTIPLKSHYHVHVITYHKLLPPSHATSFDLFLMGAYTLKITIFFILFFILVYDFLTCIFLNSITFPVYHKCCSIIPLSFSHHLFLLLFTSSLVFLSLLYLFISITTFSNFLHCSYIPCCHNSYFVS